MRPAESDDSTRIGNIEHDQFCAFADARIAGGGVELGEPWRLGNLPGERMLASAGTDEEHVHRVASVWHGENEFCLRSRL